MHNIFITLNYSGIRKLYKYIDYKNKNAIVNFVLYTKIGSYSSHSRKGLTLYYGRTIIIPGQGTRYPSGSFTVARLIVKPIDYS